MTFLMSAVLTVTALVILCLFHEEKKENKEKKKIVFSDILAVEALPYTIVAGSYSFINGIIASYLVMYADELGISGVSVYFTVCAAVLFIVRPFSSKNKHGTCCQRKPWKYCDPNSFFIHQLSRKWSYNK